MLINPLRQTLTLCGHMLSHLVGGVGLGNRHPHLVDEESFLKKKKKKRNTEQALKRNGPEHNCDHWPHCDHDSA